MTLKARCGWCGTDPLYCAYHDEEWGVPEHDPRALFEKLVLDGFQAGLSWITILRKRDSFRRAFAAFEPEKIARFTEKKVETLLQDSGIVRSRLKIEGAIRNARAYLAIEEQSPGGFHDFIWKHVEGRPQQSRPRAMKDVPAETPMSRALSKELKKAGFTFCGPVIVYAFAQAVGMVNDHVENCFRQAEVARLAKPQPRPR